MEAGPAAAVACRAATTADLPAVAELQRAWAEEAITWGFRAATPEELLPRLGPLFLVAGDGPAVVGFAYGAIRTAGEESAAVFPAGARYLEIEDLYVAAACRQRGTGGALIDALIAAAAAQGVMRARVYSAAKELDRALSFYRRHGFRSWYVELVR